MFIVYSNAEAIPILYKHDIHLLKHTQSVSLQGNDWQQFKSLVVSIHSAAICSFLLPSGSQDHMLNTSQKRGCPMKAGKND